jgi:hypothetical protein
MLNQRLLKLPDLAAQTPMPPRIQRLARQRRERRRVSTDLASKQPNSVQPGDRPIPVTARIVEPVALPTCPRTINAAEFVPVALAPGTDPATQGQRWMPAHTDDLPVELNLSGLADGEVVSPVSNSGVDRGLCADDQQAVAGELVHVG